MVDLIRELTASAARDGAAVVGFGVLMALVVYQTVASAKRAKRREEVEQARTDLLYKQLLHGDGNGAPNLARIEARQDELVGRVASVEGDVNALRTDHAALRAEVVKLRTDGCTQLEAHRTAKVEGATK